MDIKDYIDFTKSSFLLKVKIIPGQPKSEFYSVLDDGTLKIRIKAPAEKGKANKELICFLAKNLAIAKSCIDIVAGASDRTKILKFKDLDKLGK